MLNTLFRPHPLLKGPHRQTIASWLAGGEPPLGGTRIIRIPLVDGNETTIHLNAPMDEGAGTPTLVLIHGLEGDATRPYMSRLARKALAIGFRTARMNMRCCGDAEGLSSRFYNGAQSEDVASACHWLKHQYPGTKIFVAGYSLGGNLSLKAAGERLIPELSGVVAVCPPVAPFLSARSLAHWKNSHYQYNFVSGMVDRVERLAQVHGIPLPNPLSKRMSLMEFDAAFTVPHAGFLTLDHYYETCATGPLLPRIACPWLIITAQDDPIVPYESFRDLEGTPHLLAPPHGGHVGFIGYGKAEDPDVRWSENRTLEFFLKLRNGRS